MQFAIDWVAGNDAISTGRSKFMGDLTAQSRWLRTDRHMTQDITWCHHLRGFLRLKVRVIFRPDAKTCRHPPMRAAHLSVWPSRSRPYRPACCPPSDNTRHLWPAASCTRCRQSSAGGRRSPALSSPPVWAGSPADRLRIWSRISFWEMWRFQWLYNNFVGIV